MNARAIGAAIRAARTDAGLTQADLGGRLGVPQNLVSRWERGKQAPGVVRLVQIASALHCDAVISSQQVSFWPTGELAPPPEGD